MPFFLMILNCVAIMVIIAILSAGNPSTACWVLLIMAMQIQVLVGSWAIAIQLIEWILCTKLVKFQAETPHQDLSAKKYLFQSYEKKRLRKLIAFLITFTVVIVLSPCLFSWN